MREHKQHHEEMEQQQSIKQWVAILGGIIFTVSLASLLVEWGVMGSTANAHLQVIKYVSALLGALAGFATRFSFKKQKGGL